MNLNLTCPLCKKSFSTFVQICETDKRENSIETCEYCLRDFVVSVCAKVDYDCYTINFENIENATTPKKGWPKGKKRT